MMNDERDDLMTAASISGESGESVIVSAETNPIAIKIRDTLLMEPCLGGANLKISIRDDHAIISGSTRTEAQRELVLNTTGRFVGRDRVIASIEVVDQRGVDVCEK